ncbi:hypothetical protein [Marinimicrobium alkaliphilum]|uniref:hypothetical protein n=1 Tax=Marinimicrobium alkaliphilum TaxID=2202654 RepID=UPI000DB98F22|nr:hypothetical protein [Marinimicrobium alkaliphilum]
MTLENFYFWAFGLSFLTFGPSWILFARLTMARIERQIAQDGYPRPCPWDGPGGRALWYAYAVGLPIGLFNDENDPFINVPLVRRYATPADKIRGFVMVVSGNIFVVVAVIGGWYLGI